MWRNLVQAVQLIHINIIIYVVIDVDVDFGEVVFTLDRSPYGAILCKPPRLRTDVLTLTIAVRHS